jgi:hypothetical protein
VSEEEPIFTYARRNTGAIITDSPLGQHSSVASPKVPNDDSLDKNAPLDIGNNHESESDERGRVVGAAVAWALVVAAYRCAAALPLVVEAEGVAVVVVVDMQPTLCPSKVRSYSETMTKVRRIRSRRPRPRWRSSLDPESLLILGSQIWKKRQGRNIDRCFATVINAARVLSSSPTARRSLL